MNAVTVRVRASPQCLSMMLRFAALCLLLAVQGITVAQQVLPGSPSRGTFPPADSPPHLHPYQHDGQIHEPQQHGRDTIFNRQRPESFDSGDSRVPNIERELNRHLPGIIHPDAYSIDGKVDQPFNNQARQLSKEISAEIPIGSQNGGISKQTMDTNKRSSFIVPSLKSNDNMLTFIDGVKSSDASGAEYSGGIVSGASGGHDADVASGVLLNSGAGVADSSEVGELLRRVDDIRVECLSNFMTVTLKFSSPFSGRIYPYNHFRECLLFTGSNHRSTTISLRHGFCGREVKTITEGQDTVVDPIFEHHLMVQWEQEFVSEDDVSAIVRCDRPDNYNKTISWNLAAGDTEATVERSTHPGPQMWMDIERGEGPSAPSLSNEIVYVGDALTLVFTLSDNVFWFDSNVLSCYAFDGSGEKRRIQWENTGDVHPRHTYSGQLMVIENGCSTKPKLFSHFFKRRETKVDGTKTSLHYAHFKAFRFPTSLKIQIECNVEVCYRGCREMQPCSVGFHPRGSTVSGGRRTRRAVGQDPSNPETPHELDRVNFRKTIEVHLKNGETRDEKPPLSSAAEHDHQRAGESDGLTCYPSNIFFGTVISLAVSVVLLALLLLVCTFRGTNVRPVFYTPQKQPCQR